MREQKYKAWNHIVNRMSASYTLEELHAEDINFLNVKFLDYIGQKDMTGNEVYDGDVVNYMFDYDDEKLQKKAKRYKGFVGWCADHSAFEISDNPDTTHGLVFNAGNFCQIEVIGNIYENPELLKNE